MLHGIDLVVSTDIELPGAVLCGKLQCSDNEIELRESNDCQSRPQGRHQADRKCSG